MSNTTEQDQKFERWLVEYRAMLHHVANAFTSGAADRADLLQELMLAVWKAASAFREASSPSTYIYKVAHNAALNWTRTQRNYRRRLDRYESSASFDPEPARSGLDADLLEALYDEIRALPPLDRSFALLLLDGLGPAEIAEIHGVTANSVAVRLHRIKQKLTKNMRGVINELR